MRMYIVTVCASLWIISNIPLMSASVVEEITVTLGGVAILPCRVITQHIVAIEWTRPDLEDGYYVLVYRNRRIESEGQHPFYKHRVELMNKSGSATGWDVSMILTNVTAEDSGLYECHVVVSHVVVSHNKKSSFETEPIAIINLIVSHKKDTFAQRVDLLVATLFFILVVVGIVVVGIVVIMLKRRLSEQQSTVEP